MTEQTYSEAQAPSKIETFSLDRLVLSDLNVRKTERDADIAALAEDIAARGLKQNLVVTPAHDSTAQASARVAEDESAGEVHDWAYKLEVIAGGRRYQALQLLVADGRLPADHPVPCLVELRGEARETSLSENLHRVAMNAADEFEAFAAICAQLAEGGSTEKEAIALCARRFGKTMPYVEGRLRLADLAPEILQALREDRVGIEAAKAYAAVSDHKLQLAVFREREKDSWHGHKPSAIRDRLRGKTIPLGDRRVTFVGLDVYPAAGGRTEVEMFMGESGEERLIDPGKLDKLARDRAEAMIAELARKEGFKEGLYATMGTYDANWPKAPKGFARAHDYYGTKPSKAKLKKSIAVYSIARDGTGLDRVGRFRPDDEKDAPRGGGYTPPTPEEIAAERRERGISALASRLAVGTFAGSPFEGRAFWPAGDRWIEAVTELPGDELLVVVQVKVSKVDIEAQREAATNRYDDELAEAEAEKLRQAQAIADEHGAEVGEILDDMDDDDLEEVAAA